MIGTHEPTGFICTDTQQGIVRSSEQIRDFPKMGRIPCVSAIIERNTIPLQHESSPQSLPSITYGTFAPMLCRQESYFQPLIFQLLIPAGLDHSHFRKPALYQFSGSQTAKQFHLRIIIQQTGDTLLVQMVKMVMTDKQVINFCKNVGIGRKLTLSFHKRDVSENRIEHDSFACQLKEEGIMSQPY